MSLSTSGVLYALGALAVAVKALKVLIEPPEGGTGISATPKSSRTRDLFEVAVEGKHKIVIVYGSQTGTARDYAIRLAREINDRFGVVPLVAAFNEYSFDSLDRFSKDHLVVFVSSTYGEGEPPDMAVEFLNFLEDVGSQFSKGSRSKPLECLHYAIFGLGNKTYQHFNAVCRRIDARMQLLGATRIGSRGEGNDDQSLEEDFLSWRDDTLRSVASALGLDSHSRSRTSDFIVEPTIETNVFHGELSEQALHDTPSWHDAKNPLISRLACARELYRNEERSCVHLEFDITGSGWKYSHGDHLGIWPCNPDFEVTRLLRLLGLEEQSDRGVMIVATNPVITPVPFPSPSTYRAIFRNYLDISGIVPRDVLKNLAEFAPTQLARATIEKLASDKKLYHHVVVEGHLNLAGALEFCAKDETSSTRDVWHIPIDCVVSSLKRLQPRFYSISSSPKMHPNFVHVTIVTLSYTTNDVVSGTERRFFGLGSNYALALAREYQHRDNGLLPDVTHSVPARVTAPQYALFAPVHLRRSKFRLPLDPAVPVIMIGPGTGVAPFRGFVQERVALARQAIAHNGSLALSKWAPMYLFFGCRDDTDHLYRDEWKSYTNELCGKLLMSVAHSRSGARQADGFKTYVQHLLWERRDELRSAITTQNAIVYICGDGKSMSKAVESRLQEMLGGGEIGEIKMSRMREQGRLLLDVW